MFEKVGFWGSVASIISLALVFLLPIETADSQDKHGNKVEVHGSVSGDAFGGDKVGGDKVGGDKIIINQPPLIINQPPQVDPQLSAQGMRVAAETSRTTVQRHVRPPFPKEWLDAENFMKNGNNLYNQLAFEDAYKNFDAAFRLYTDLRSAIVHQ